MSMDTKALRGVEIKDETRGEVTAVFATLDVVDHDGDVTLAGAFEDGAPVRISAYGHASWGGALPVGKGVIRATGKEAILEGQFFLSTTTGRDTFEVVKQLGEAGLQEWSYGFDAVDYSYGEHEGRHVRFLNRLKVHEVSPVLLGAGIDTRVLSTKGHMTFADEGAAVLAAVRSLGDRAADVLAKRLEKGKGLGAESAALLEQVEAELKRFAELLARPETDDDADPGLGEVQREWLRDLARGL
jgi:hypothetical protein